MLARLGDAAHIHFPYLMLCGLFLLLAVLIAVVPLPQFKNEEKVKIGAQALKDTTLLLGIVAIFCYVGAEVSIGSSFKNCSKELIPGITDENSNIMLAFYWGGLMIGRFLGSLSLVNFKSTAAKYGLMTGVSLATFGVLLAITYFLHPDTFTPKQMLPYLIFIIINIFGFMVGKSHATQLIAVFSGVNIIFLICAMVVTGYPTIWLLVGTGLFNSVMWGNIFSTAIAKLGVYRAQGSSLLVMAIVGGALLPPLQGLLADQFEGYHFTYIVPILAYCYLVFFGIKCTRELKIEN